MSNLQDAPDIESVVAGRSFKLCLGADYIDQFWCLRQRALTFDEPEKPVEVSGTNAARIVEKVFSHKGERLGPHDSRPSQTLKERADAYELRR